MGSDPVSNNLFEPNFNESQVIFETYGIGVFQKLLLKGVHPDGALILLSTAFDNIPGQKHLIMVFMKNIWFVYIIKCGDGTLYTGSTNNLESRIVKHNIGKGCRYTRGRRPVRLMYVEELPDRSSALKREARLKSWNRRKKLLLIQGEGEGHRHPPPLHGRRPFLFETEKYDII